MHALMGMSTDKMIIVLPSALILMYLVITLQKYLSTRESRYPGLVLPVICFIVSTVLAVRPLFVGDTQQSGLIVFCIRMWLTFNISTILFGFQYIREKRKMRTMAELAAQQELLNQQDPASDCSADCSISEPEYDPDEDEQTRLKREYEKKANIERCRRRI